MDGYLNERQLMAAQKLARAGRGLVWWKVGTGKTRIALHVYHTRYRDRGACVVIGSPMAERQWRDEIALAPYGFNQSEFIYFSAGMLPSENGVIDLTRLAMEHRVSFVVADEAWMYKNPRTRRHLALSRLAALKPTLGLSGSLITANNLEDLYGQAAAVRIADPLARNLTQFRTRYCVSAEEHGLKFYARKGALEEVQQRLAPWVDVYFPAEAREVRHQAISVNPTAAQCQLLKQLRREYYATLDNAELEVKNSGVLLSKFLQVSDGVVLDNEGNPHPIRSDKLSRMVQLCHELIDAGERVIVWFAFRASIDEALKHVTFPVVVLRGGEEFEADAWNEHARVCFATVGAGASLNDFAQTAYAIIYSAPYSHRAMQQALGRTNRTNSRHQTCHYYWLQTAGTPDWHVYDNLRITAQNETHAIQTYVEILRGYHAKEPYRFTGEAVR